VPAEANGIQVNFCKNPACSNYGVVAKAAVRRGSAAHGLAQDTYVVQTGGVGLRVLHCRACGEFPPIKSNAAIDEERSRFLTDLIGRPAPSCPDASCSNHSVPLSGGHNSYQSFGLTKSGSQRYRCKACRKTFAVGNSTTGHKRPHKNRTVFSLLMNKSPMRRICEVADIDPKTLYGKIDFLQAQCLAFVSERERRLRGGMALPRLYLATDRQDYIVNWAQQQDRRNVVLHAVGTADNVTGYVFGLHLNYDPILDAEAVERAVVAAGDYQSTPPFRRYARCWLRADYQAAAARRVAAGRRLTKSDLQSAIAATYAEAVQREDVEVAEAPDPSRRLPARGVQIHAEYTLYGHFFFLRQLFGGVEKLRFCMDQDSGMRAACLAAFQPEIKARKDDAFYVRIARDLTVSQKRAALAASRAQFETARHAHPGLSNSELQLLLIKAAIGRMAKIGKWQDRWLTDPFPSMNEPEKAVCYLTDYGDYDPDHLARLYHKASLHGIDRFFMQVRRRLSLLERPIATASNAERMWYGYGAYNPESIVKLLGIFRVFYNYCLAGKDGRTPAQRLGLARGTVSLEDIIYF
jgi:transposase-like protein